MRQAHIVLEIFIRRRPGGVGGVGIGSIIEPKILCIRCTFQPICNAVKSMRLKYFLIRLGDLRDDRLVLRSVYHSIHSFLPLPESFEPFFLFPDKLLLFGINHLFCLNPGNRRFGHMIFGNRPFDLGPVNPDCGWVPVSILRFKFIMLVPEGF